MLQRYSQYFLSHILWLIDHRADYFVQEPMPAPEDAFGVERLTFNGPRQAVDLLNDCMAHDHTTIHRLRRFLAEDAPRGYLVHHMDDEDVVEEIARILVDYRYPIVIRPYFEPPWRATSTIDVLDAVKQGAAPAELKKSPALAGTETKLKNAYAAQKSTGESDGQKHHQAQLKLLNLGERPLSRAKLLRHTGKGWDHPDAFSKVLANHVNIIFNVSPDTLRQYPIDTVVSGPVIDEFIAWLGDIWPPPETMEQLLAAFTLGWLYKKVERPAAETAREIPKIPPKKQKQTPVEPPVFNLNAAFDQITISYKDNQISEEPLSIQAGYELGGPKKLDAGSGSYGQLSIFHGDIPNGSYTMNFKGFDLEHDSLTE